VKLERVRAWLGWIGALGALVTLAAIFHGLWRGLRQPFGRTSGRTAAWLRRPAFYLAAGLGYFGLCARLWRPLPLRPSRLVDGLMLLLGTLLYFPGLALMLWGRLTMKDMHNVSTDFGSQLYADHRLVTSGPFALIRHPMYVGGMMAEIGALLLYRTWATLLIMINVPLLPMRARREEDLLASRFGAEWTEYKRRVPRWIPSLPGLWTVD
jgi:hypothetical protein